MAQSMLDGPASRGISAPPAPPASLTSTSLEFAASAPPAPLTSTSLEFAAGAEPQSRLCLETLEVPGPTLPPQSLAAAACSQAEPSASLLSATQVFGGTRERMRAAGLPSPKPTGILKPAGAVGAGAGAEQHEGSSSMARVEEAGKRRKVAILSPQGASAAEAAAGGAAAAVGDAAAAGTAAPAEAPALAPLRQARGKLAQGGAKRAQREGSVDGVENGSGEGCGTGAKRVRSSSNSRCAPFCHSRVWHSSFHSYPLLASNTSHFPHSSVVARALAHCASRPPLQARAFSRGASEALRT